MRSPTLDLATEIPTTAGQTTRLAMSFVARSEWTAATTRRRRSRDNGRETRWGNGRVETQVPGEKEPPRGEQATETTKPATRRPRDDKARADTVSRTETVPRARPTAGWPGTASSPKAAVAVAAARSSNCLASSHQESPEMQLPDELTPGEPGEPGGPAVLDAGAPVVAPSPVGGAAPIVLPVIVAPPIGLGGGAGGAGSPVTPTWPAPRRHRRVARRTRPAAGQRGQQRRARLVLPDRIHRISANRRTAAGRRLGNARNCGHSCTNRRRGISRVPPGEGGQRGAGGWHSTLHQVMQTAPPNGGGQRIVDSSKGGSYASQSSRYPRRQCGVGSRPATR